MSKHTLTLNNGGIHQLAQVLGAPGLLTEPADLYRAGQFLEEHLTELPKAEDLPKDADQITATKLVYGWQRKGEHKLEVSERLRDTAKKAIQAAASKGGLAPGPGLTSMLNAFGLAPEA